MASRVSPFSVRVRAAKNSISSFSFIHCSSTNQPQNLSMRDCGWTFNWNSFRIFFHLFNSHIWKVDDIQTIQTKKGSIWKRRLFSGCFTESIDINDQEKAKPQKFFNFQLFLLFSLFIFLSWDSKRYQHWYNIKNWFRSNQTRRIKKKGIEIKRETKRWVCTRVILFEYRFSSFSQHKK